MSDTINIGFTGTRMGMSREQQRVFQELIEKRTKQYQIKRFVHGGAIGADEQADQIVCELGIPITVRPGSDDRYLYWVEKDDGVVRAVYSPEKPLDRNQLIVDSVTEMFATPVQMTEINRSGTWATIRYTRKRDKLLTIIYPDGSLSFDP